MNLQQAMDAAVNHHRAGRLAEAETLYRQILATSPDQPDALQLLGVMALQTGNPQPAVQLISRAVQLVPNSPEFHHHLALAFDAASQPDQAYTAFQRAIALRPDYVEALNGLGNFLAARARREEAAQCYQRVISLKPNFAAAWNNLGNILGELGRRDDAIAHYRKAISIQPDYADAWSNLGNRLREAGDYPAAITACRRALELRPDSVEAQNNLANALKQSGQPDQAIAAYRRALEMNPSHAEAANNLGATLYEQLKTRQAIDYYHLALKSRPQYAEAHNNLGAALRELGQLDAALEAYEQALKLNPNFAEALGNYGAALRQSGRLSQAIAACRRAVELKPDFYEAWNDLGVAFYESDHLDEAIECYRQTLALNPRHTEAQNNLGVAYKDRGLVRQAVECYDRVLALKPHDAAVESNRLQTLHFLEDFDPGVAFQLHLDWAKRHAEPLRKITHARRTDSDRPLRIGYVSADFRHHSVAFYFLPLLENHDRKRFHISCYYNIARQDHVTQRIRAGIDNWVNLLGLSDAEAADRVHADNIDILIDLLGHTAHNRLLMFAQKPAPVQVTFLGYPYTTALSTMDWRLTDELSDPAGAEAYHTEKLYRLPHTAWCFHPLSGSPDISPSPRTEGNPDTAPVAFGSFNNLAKITDPTLHAWARILAQLPHSRLILKNRASNSPLTCDRLRKFLTSAGATPDQIEFIPSQDSPLKHLNCYDRLDIALDTYPYHGTTTTCESLWMGVPVVTRAGVAHVSRVGVSLLTNLGLTDLIASDEDEYVRIAVQIARDHARLRDLRSSLRQRMRESVLMDAPTYARGIESAYDHMWRTWLNP